MLSLNDVTLRFAGVTALDRVSLDVPEGELVAVIGPNGAGKTSLFNCICGLYHPQEGQIRFQDADLTRLAAWRRATLGIGRMFQNIALYDHLTVLENLMVGRHHRYRTSILHDLLRTRRFRQEEIRHRQHVEDIIDFLDLALYRDTPAMVLPYGLLKRVELGRALATEPRLLLLDEPAAGLNQEETEDMARYLLDIREELGVTQILIEHDLSLVLDLADRIAVLDFGRKIAEGSPEDIRSNADVSAAYTGGLT
ncbi:MAG: ABC transporter ATP-binding protein [Myxococcales bacterium]|nr:ABC transporter ATP-binding protein [Myxococcales bacterium]